MEIKIVKEVHVNEDPENPSRMEKVGLSINGIVGWYAFYNSKYDSTDQFINFNKMQKCLKEIASNAVFHR